MEFNVLSVSTNINISVKHTQDGIVTNANGSLSINKDGKVFQGDISFSKPINNIETHIGRVGFGFNSQTTYNLNENLGGHAESMLSMAKAIVADLEVKYSANTL